MAKKRGYGRLLEEARLSAGYSQAEAAEALGLSGHYDISRLESESKRIEPELYERLLAVYHTLRRHELVGAMGFPVAAPAAERGVPEELAKLCAQLDQQELRVLIEVARGQLALRRGHR